MFAKVLSVIQQTFPNLYDAPNYIYGYKDEIDKSFPKGNSQSCQL